MLWKSRMDKEGRVREPAREVIEKMDTLSQQVKQGEIIASGRNDVLTIALGTNEHPGRVRGKGKGVTLTGYFGRIPSAKNSLSQSGTSGEAALRSEVARLRQMVEEMHARQSTPPTSSHGKDPDPVGDITSSLASHDLPMGWTRCQLASPEAGHPIVATGDVFYGDGLEPVMLHHKPIDPGYLKVSITEPLEPDVQLPVPTLGAETVGEAHGAMIAWPKHLIFHNTKLHHKGGKNPDQDDNNCAKSPSVGESDVRLGGNEMLTEEDKAKLTTPLMRTTYKALRRMNLPITIPIPMAMVGSDDIFESIGADEIKQLLFQKEIEAAHISTYSVYLFNKCQEQGLRHLYGFLHPNNIAWYQGVAPKVREQYIVDTMNKTNPNKIFFAPYYKDHHWMLAIIHPTYDVAYWLGPLWCDPPADCRNMIDTALTMWNVIYGCGKRPRKKTLWMPLKCPKQPNFTDCGYYVLRYMEDIIKKGNGKVSETYLGDDTTRSGYLQHHLDETREKWLEFIQDYE